MEERNKTNHYYISLPSQKTEADIIDFEMKMLEQNQIRGLLPAAREYQDTEVKIYFDISGRQNLEQRYAWQKLRGQEVRQILRKIAEVAAELEEYMLDYNHLNLMPEFMYGMLNPGDLCFCYEPWDSMTFGERLRPLALWFLDHMDYREREEVIFSYEFQRFCEENDVSLALLGQFMDGETAKENLREGKEVRKQRERRNGLAAVGVEAEAKLRSEIGEISGKEEETNDASVWAGMFSDAGRKKNGGMKELLRRIFPAGGKSYPDYSAMDSLRFAEDETEYGRKTTRGRENARSQNDGESDALFSESGEEVKTEDPVLGKLISEKMPTLHIRGFPCFLGSDGNLTDCEIADESVSRIHVRLFESDGRIWVEDLRSENGTFLNGDRMLPNEPWVLKDKDELKVGDCLYRFQRF